LSAEHWESPTLCERWRVRDVVAHVISYQDLGFVSLAGRFVKGRLKIDRINAMGVDDFTAVPPERLVDEFRRHIAPLVRGAWRARGVRLVADDLDWSHGPGPEVRGNGEALLMAMAGRRAALGDLTGLGVERLARRF
jgi:hypothetical protein